MTKIKQTAGSSVKYRFTVLLAITTGSAVTSFHLPSINGNANPHHLQHLQRQAPSPINNDYPNKKKIFSTKSTTSIQLSSDNFDSDELAKLRKKRQEILSKKKTTPIEDILTNIPTPSAESSSSEASAASSASAAAASNENDGSTTIEKPITKTPDLNTLPKLERPSILQSRVAAKEAAAAAKEAASSAKDADSEKKSPTPSNTNKNPGIDYLADYEDENDLHIPNRIGFGTMAWGDERYGFVPKKNKKLKKKQIAAGKFVPGDLQVAYNTLLQGGIRFIETSELYGVSKHEESLSAESLVGGFTEDYTLTTDTPLISTTFANPYKLFMASGGKSGIRAGSGALLRALELSCQRLETSNIELYQISNMQGAYAGGKKALAGGLALALDRGYCNHVGVCDLGPKSLRVFQRMMEQRGASISTNQIEFSLTNRKALRKGTIQACKSLGIIPIAYNPLGDGLASGQYTANNPTGGVVGGEMKFNFKKELEPLIPLHDAQAMVATRVKERLRKETREENERRSRKYQNPLPVNAEITPYQVAINYIVAKGAVPIPVIKNNQEAEELLGCIGWGLSDEEVDILDKAADLCRC